MRRTTLVVSLALSLAGAAQAGFIGCSSDRLFIEGKWVWRVYAQFDSANDVVLSVFGVQGLGATSWNQSDFVGGSWNPQFTQNGGIDTFVTIGGTPGFSNTTAADPNWGALGFNQPGIPNNAGWFNSNPPNLQGKVDANFRTLIAQFTYVGIDVPAYVTPVTVSFNQGLGTPTQFSSGATMAFGFVPAPATFALLGLGAFARRRRQ